MSFSSTIFFVGLLSLLWYIGYLISFYFGLKRRSTELEYKKKRVSVIIAARNEEDNIGRLLTALINQSYPVELYDVIIADDRSEDQTAQIVKQYAEKWPQIKLVTIEKAPEKFSPKKYALSRAIKESKGEIIILTDADCLVTKYWLEAMISNFTVGVSMVAGFSRTQISNWHNSSLLEKFEYFDFLLMFMAAAGAILSGKYFSCSNQNLAYLRSAYEQVGGFEKIKYLVSGDDVNLMQLFRRHRLKVRFSLIEHSFVYTQSVKSVQHLISQRSRWASNAKWQLYLNPEFFFFLTAVFLIHLTIIILLFLNWQAAILLVVIKLISEYIFVATNFKLFERERKRLRFFPAWSILQPFYIVLVTVRGIFELFSWKP